MLRAVVVLGLLCYPERVPCAEIRVRGWDGNYLSVFDLGPEKRSESFSSLATTSVPTRQAAVELATDYWLRTHRLLAEERLVVVGLYRLGRNITGVGTHGDWVWEVRVLHLGLGVDGVMWVNAGSRKIFSIGP